MENISENTVNGTKKFMKVIDNKKIKNFNMSPQESPTLKVKTNCEEIDKHSVTGYTKFVGMEQPEVKPVEHALVDDRITYGIPKKPSFKEAGSPTTRKVGQFTLINKEHENKRILLIDFNGNNFGIITYKDVISIAEEKNLDPIVLKEDDDLVVAKLVNLDKYLYEIKKKIKKNKAANSKNKLKEISYRLVTSNHDLERIKTKIMEWLDKKMKVKVHLQLKGREFNNVDNIRKDFVSFLENLGKITNISYNKNVGFSAILETKK